MLHCCPNVTAGPGWWYSHCPRGTAQLQRAQSLLMILGVRSHASAQCLVSELGTKTYGLCAEGPTAFFPVSFQYRPHKSLHGDQ